MSLKHKEYQTYHLFYNSKTLHIAHTECVVFHIILTLNNHHFHKLDIRLCSSSATALGPTQPSIQWIPMTLSPGTKQMQHKADHSPPCSAEVENEWSCISTLPCANTVCTEKALPLFYLYFHNTMKWLVLLKEVQCYFVRQKLYLDELHASKL